MPHADLDYSANEFETEMPGVAPSAREVSFEYMKPETRRAVAYIAGRLISGLAADSVYDYSAGKYALIDGTVTADPIHVDVYDYDASCHVGGDDSDLYHHGNSAHLELKLNGHKFSGYDYDSSNFYEGEVDGRNISLYDYGSGWFSYSL